MTAIPMAAAAAKTLPAKPEPTILSSLDRRVLAKSVLSETREIVRDLRRRRHEAAAYNGGLPAERDSAKALRARRKADRRLIRAAAVRRLGRKIDLVGLLNLSRPDGHPVWAIVDPRGPINHSNGACGDDGVRAIYSERETRPGAWCQETQWISGLRKRDQAGTSTSIPGGLPALPAQVREVFTAPAHRKLRRRAKWIGVLYQPAEWTHVDPDPAVVVEWRDRPGEYYALMVWGVDGPGIQEWIA
jgi:hypothetical protein